jgi:hypothetical protein
MWRRDIGDGRLNDVLLQDEISQVSLKSQVVSLSLLGLHRQY